VAVVQDDHRPVDEIAAAAAAAVYAGDWTGQMFEDVFQSVVDMYGRVVSNDT
jgi:hypothetical protein